MKRSKIMLTAIGVLAVVGGALALKANHFGNVNYCYTITAVNNLDPTICPKAITQVSFLAPVAGATRFYKYTVTTNTTRCTLAPACTKVARTTTIQ